MLRRKLLVLSGASVATLSLTGCFQAAMQGVQLASSLTGGEPVSEKTLLANQKALKAGVKSFVSSLSTSQVLLATALGLKAQAAEVKQSAKAFAKGVTDIDSLDKVKNISQEANSAIEAALEKAGEFTKSQQKKVSESLEKYASAAVAATKVGAIAGQSALQVTSTLASGKVTDLAKLKDQMSFTIDAGSNIPSFAADLVKHGWSYIELAKERGVDTTAASDTLKEAVGF